jgi:hypothetical protein
VIRIHYYQDTIVCRILDTLADKLLVEFMGGSPHMYSYGEFIFPGDTLYVHKDQVIE